MGLRLLDWSRQDLLKVVESLPPEQVYKPIESEVHQTIAGVLEHISRAENWYLDRLDLATEWPSLPEGAVDKLAAVRTNMRDQLVKLIGETRVTASCGERWSARKVLRRTLWHERDHTQHIVELATRVK